VGEWSTGSPGKRKITRLICPSPVYICVLYVYIIIFILWSASPASPYFKKVGKSKTFESFRHVPESFDLCRKVSIFTGKFFRRKAFAGKFRCKNGISTVAIQSNVVLKELYNHILCCFSYSSSFQPWRALRWAMNLRRLTS
jgi:hypothetical protein